MRLGHQRHCGVLLALPQTPHSGGGTLHAGRMSKEPCGGCPSAEDLGLLPSHVGECGIKPPAPVRPSDDCTCHLLHLQKRL